MAHSATNKKKPVAAMLVMGIISVALYATLLLKQDLINSTFAKGGLYAFLPVVTAFVFSYFHGAFTGHFWTVLGVEAARKKKEVK
jgi:F0F1-type ATP synthase assembly protein I